MEAGPAGADAEVEPVAVQVLSKPHDASQCRSGLIQVAAAPHPWEFPDKLKKGHASST